MAFWGFIPCEMKRMREAHGKNCVDHFSPEIIFLAHKKFSIWIYLNVNIFLRAYFRALTCKPIRRCKAHVGSLILILNCKRASNSAYIYGRADHSKCKSFKLMLRRLFFHGAYQVAFACKLKIYFRNDSRELIHLTCRELFARKQFRILL